MTRELRRYRLFLTFLLVPLFIVALIIIFVANVFFASDSPPDGAAVTLSGATTPTLSPTLPTSADTPAAVTTPVVAVATPTPIAPLVPTAAPPPPPTATPTVAPIGSYVVADGDTLYGIALQYGLTTDELAAFNGITDPVLLPIGQELAIPAPGTVVVQTAAAPVVTAAPAPTAASTTLLGTVSTGGPLLNVRSAPSLSASEVVGQLDDGVVVQLTGRTQLADGVTWYETANGNWLHGNFLQIP